MRRSPSIIPDVVGQDIYLVLDNFGSLGRSWRETDEEHTDRATLVRSLVEGQYNGPIRVVAFNTAQGWSRDVSEEIADEVAQVCANEDKHIPGKVVDFIERHGSGRPAQLPLPLRGAA